MAFVFIIRLTRLDHNVREKYRARSRKTRGAQELDRKKKERLTNKLSITNILPETYSRELLSSTEQNSNKQLTNTITEGVKTIDKERKVGRKGEAKKYLD